MQEPRESSPRHELFAVRHQEYVCSKTQSTHIGLIGILGSCIEAFVIFRLYLCNQGPNDDLVLLAPTNGNPSTEVERCTPRVATLEEKAYQVP